MFTCHMRRKQPIPSSSTKERDMLIEERSKQTRTRGLESRGASSSDQSTVVGGKIDEKSSIDPNRVFLLFFFTYLLSFLLMPCLPQACP